MHWLRWHVPMHSDCLNAYSRRVCSFVSHMHVPPCHMPSQWFSSCLKTPGIQPPLTVLTLLIESAEPIVGKSKLTKSKRDNFNRTTHLGQSVEAAGKVYQHVKIKVISLLRSYKLLPTMLSQTRIAQSEEDCQLATKTWTLCKVIDGNPLPPNNRS